MEVFILGSGTGLPSLRRGPAGLVIRVGDETMLFDSGSGSLGKLLRIGLTYQDIDRIFYTHLHPDHTADLAPLLFVMRNPDDLRKKPLPMVGPKGFKEFYQRLLNLYGEWIGSESYELTTKDVLEDEIKGKGWRVRSKPLLHEKYCVGYRIESDEGKVITYSGDTDYCENIVDLAKGADLLILECSFPNERRVRGHLTPSLAGRIAKEAGAKKLLLTHLYPICDRYNIKGECREIFKGEVILAEDLLHSIV